MPSRVPPSLPVHPIPNSNQNQSRWITGNDVMLIDAQTHNMPRFVSTNVNVPDNEPSLPPVTTTAMPVIQQYTNPFISRQNLNERLSSPIDLRNRRSPNLNLSLGGQVGNGEIPSNINHNNQENQITVPRTCPFVLRSRSVSVHEHRPPQRRHQWQPSHHHCAAANTDANIGSSNNNNNNNMFITIPCHTMRPSPFQASAFSNNNNSNSDTNNNSFTAHSGLPPRAIPYAPHEALWRRQQTIQERHRRSMNTYEPPRRANWHFHPTVSISANSSNSNSSNDSNNNNCNASNPESNSNSNSSSSISMSNSSTTTTNTNQSTTANSGNLRMMVPRIVRSQRVPRSGPRFFVLGGDNSNTVPWLDPPFGG